MKLLVHLYTDLEDKDQNFKWAYFFFLFNIFNIVQEVVKKMFFFFLFQICQLRKLNETVWTFRYGPANRCRIERFPIC